MTTNKPIAACVAIALLTSGCSTKPRTFSAMVRPAAEAAPDGQSETVSFGTCDQLVRKGYRSNFAAAAASGATTGVAMLGGAAAVAASGTIGIGATGTGVALSAAVPVIGIFAGFGVNRLIRSGKERKYKRAMTDCMHELGYEVTDWTRAPKHQPGTATLIEASTAAAPVEPRAPLEPKPEQAATAGT